MTAGADSVCILVTMRDTTGIELMAMINAPDQSPIDSLKLFDDGNHCDETAGDGLFANIWHISSIEELQYDLDLKVKRIETDTVINIFNTNAIITTNGLVTYETFAFDTIDAIPNPGDSLKLKITLKNNSSLYTCLLIFLSFHTIVPAGL